MKLNTEIVTASLLLFTTTLLVGPVTANDTTTNRTASNKTDRSNIEEVLVKQRKYDSSITIQTEKLVKLPGTLGDPIQAVFSLPGVVQVSDDDRSPAVRGSSPSDNDFLVDYLPAGYLFHDFGNSIFNENLIKDFGLNAAGFGARYGNATGAVFDVTLRDPRNQPLVTTLDLSFLRAGVLLEGAATENQSFYFSYREGLINYFLDKDELEEEDDIKVHNMPQARDYQGKYLWELDNSRLSFSITGAQDKASADFGKKSEAVLLDPGMEGRAVLDELFHSQSLLWEKSTKKTHSKLALGHLLETTNDKIGVNEFIETDFSRWILKGEQGFAIGENHYFTMGADLQNRKYDYEFKLRLTPCSDFTPDCEHTKGKLTYDKRKQTINTYDAFLEDRWAITDTIELTTGVHIASDDYLKEDFVEPRVSVAWQLSPSWTLSSSVGKYHQLPEVDEILPTIGNPELRPPVATHYVVGINNTLNNGWSWKADVYYKDIDDLSIDTEDEALQYINGVEGSAYGLELMINKNLTDRWYGWASLSLSKSDRTNKQTGKATDSFYDVPIVANIVFNYQINQLWNAGFRWNLRSGSLYTPIIGNRENPDFPGFYLPVYGELNSKRDKAYHRLDFRIERKFNNNTIDGSFFIDIINLYNRKNSYGVEYEPIANSREFKLNREEGFGTFPSIGVKLIF